MRNANVEQGSMMVCNLQKNNLIYWFKGRGSQIVIRPLLGGRWGPSDLRNTELHRRGRQVRAGIQILILSMYVCTSENGNHEPMEGYLARRRALCRIELASQAKPL
jgi:hypothetical protein